MKALVLTEPGTLEYKDQDSVQSLESGSVKIELKAAALNHRDVWIKKGRYPGIKYPMILGSDGAGIDVQSSNEVIINPGLNWGDNPNYQSNQFEVLGLPSFGTFAQEVIVPASSILPKPEHLSWTQAGALPLGGVTAWRALMTKGKAKKGDKILISGIGGGVALFAFQYAVAIGAEVFVTSGSQQKIDRAIEMGAVGGVNYKDEDWEAQLKELSKGIDLVIDSAGGTGTAAFVRLANPGGRIVMYGGTLGNMKDINPQKLFWKQISIMGSTMGSPKEFEQMVEFVCEHNLVPVVDEVFTLAEGNKAIQKMEAGTQFGKLVLEIN